MGTKGLCIFHRQIINRVEFQRAKHGLGAGSIIGSTMLLQTHVSIVVNTVLKFKKLSNYECERSVFPCSPWSLYQHVFTILASVWWSSLLYDNMLSTLDRLDASWLSTEDILSILMFDASCFDNDTPACKTKSHQVLFSPNISIQLFKANRLDATWWQNSIELVKFRTYIKSFWLCRIVRVPVLRDRWWNLQWWISVFW